MVGRVNAMVFDIYHAFFVNLKFFKCFENYHVPTYRSSWATEIVPWLELGLVDNSEDNERF